MLLRILKYRLTKRRRIVTRDIIIIVHYNNSTTVVRYLSGCRFPEISSGGSLRVSVRRANMCHTTKSHAIGCLEHRHYLRRYHIGLLRHVSPVLKTTDTQSDNAQVITAGSEIIKKEF